MHDKDIKITSPKQLTETSERSNKTAFVIQTDWHSKNHEE